MSTSISVKYVAHPCDEENEAGEPVRTWDVCRVTRREDREVEHVAVASGFRTRASARNEARRLNEGGNP